ncbi:MAG: DUF6273 domain-containing protein [bacterium]|nr:DUF6273 domain-containing protein [bacterium]
MSKFCPMCGHNLPDTAAFCGNCGAHVRRHVNPCESAPASTVPPAQPAQAPASAVPPAQQLQASASAVPPAQQPQAPASAVPPAQPAQAPASADAAAQPAQAPASAEAAARTAQASGHEPEESVSDIVGSAVTEAKACAAKVGIDLAKSVKETAKASVKRTVEAKVDAIKDNITKAAPTKAEPPKAEPPKAEPAKAAPPKTEAPKAEPAKTDAPKEGAAQTKKSGNKSPKTLPSDESSVKKYNAARNSQFNPAKIVCAPQGEQPKASGAGKSSQGDASKKSAYNLKNILGCCSIIACLCLMGLVFLGGVAASFDDEKNKKHAPEVAVPSEPVIAIGTSVPKDLKAGDFVCFGHYPQGIDNAVHPIQWRVLDNDGKTVLLFSRYGLDAKQFDYWGNDMWNESSLRKWLGAIFINQAFTADEQELIAESGNRNNPAISYTNFFGEKEKEKYLEQNKNYSEISENAAVPGEAGEAAEDESSEDHKPVPVTCDKVFLLHADEVRWYLDKEADRHIIPTIYAQSHGAKVAESGLTSYWLRAGGNYGHGAMDDEKGSMYGISPKKIHTVVPALRLKIESGEK